MFSPADLIDAVAEQLHREEQSLRSETAVYGLDARSEVELHQSLSRAFEQAGYGVFAEQRYPMDRGKRRGSEGLRCDLVLTLDGKPLRQPDQADTLFDPADAADLDEAFWLEVKIVSQFTTEGPNRSYASQLLSTVRHDVTKLSRDAGILRAGLLLILFVADRRVAEHDLRVWENRCLEQSLPIEAPARRDIALTDRHGNALCALALYPVRHL